MIVSLGPVIVLFAMSVLLFSLSPPEKKQELCRGTFLMLFVMLHATLCLHVFNASCRQLCTLLLVV